MYKLNSYILILLIFFFNQQTAQAYIGPGLGAGIIASTLGILIAIIAGIIGLIIFPLKRIFQKNAKRKKNDVSKN